MDFNTWIMEKYKNWRDERPGRSGSVSAFARWLGDESKGGQTTRDWLYNGQGPKHKKQIDNLVARYGNVVYEILEIKPEDELLSLVTEIYYKIPESRRANFVNELTDLAMKFMGGEEI